jgi:hypothetical protein
LTLRALLDSRRAERRTFTLEEAIATVVPLCIDLQELHARGVRLYVHASCVAPGPDGLARLSRERSVIPTDVRDRVCLAPELVQTLEPGNARASVFAIGALLYECVTGWPIGPAMRRPRDFNPDLPEALEALIAKALVGDPAHRPDDLGALASALHHIGPMKNVPPPEVDEGRLDHGTDFEVDIRLSMLPPSELARDPVYLPAGPPSGSLSSSQAGDGADPSVSVGMAMAASEGVARRIGAPQPNVTERLAGLKARLESDPRPRYVVNKDKMDHGPFSAVELLQQITTNSFTGEHILRDELSGQSHAIREWSEFAPFAEQVALKREVIAEKKAVARVESREKKAGVAKSILGIVLVFAIGAGAALWFFEVRGSRKDDVEVADDSTLDLSLDGGIKGQKHKATGGGGGKGAGSGGMSYESAVSSNIQQIDMNGHVVGPDLTDLQLSGPLRNATFLNSCGAPDSMHVTVKVAIKMGRAVGVSVYSSPPNSGVTSCVDRAVRNLAWPVNPKLDSFVTTY